MERYGDGSALQKVSAFMYSKASAPKTIKNTIQPGASYTLVLLFSEMFKNF